MTPEIPEGWTAHDGGECPVDPWKAVAVMFRDGCRGGILNRKSAAYWQHHWLWKGMHRANDIIAYRTEQQP